jgi:hypothetical protein
MTRQLPIVDIIGTAFCVDVQRDHLWQKDNPKNRISFSVFDQDGDGYTFLYDTQQKNTPEDKADIKELGDRYKWVTLPALMELDPEGIALKYDIPLSVLCPERSLRSDGDDDEFEFYEEGIY